MSLLPYENYLFLSLMYRPLRWNGANSMTPSSSGTKYLVEIWGFRKSLTNDHLSCYIDHRLPEQPHCHGISVFLCAHSQERLRTVEENIKILSHSKHKPSGLGMKRRVIELVFILAKMFSNNNHLHSEKKKNFLSKFILSIPRWILWKQVSCIGSWILCRAFWIFSYVVKIKIGSIK